MSATPTSIFDPVAFDRVTEPVLQLLTPDQARALLSFRADEELTARIENLAAKSNEGELTVAERAEYEAYVRANKFIAILQATARRRLASGGTDSSQFSEPHS